MSYVLSCSNIEKLREFTECRLLAFLHWRCDCEELHSRVQARRGCFVLWLPPACTRAYSSCHFLAPTCTCPYKNICSPDVWWVEQQRIATRVTVWTKMRKNAWSWGLLFFRLAPFAYSCALVSSSVRGERKSTCYSSVVKTLGFREEALSRGSGPVSASWAKCCFYYDVWHAFVA